MGTASAKPALVHGDLTNEIIGAFFEVYNALGYGFLEAVYQRALPVALKARGLRCAREVALDIHYLGECVGQYRADLLVEGKVIVETKTADRIIPVHELQLLNYLKASALEVGVVLNFGPHPTFRRWFSHPQEKDPRPSARFRRHPRSRRNGRILPDPDLSSSAASPSPACA